MFLLFSFNALYLCTMYRRALKIIHCLDNIAFFFSEQQIWEKSDVPRICIHQTFRAVVDPVIDTRLHSVEVMLIRSLLRGLLGIHKTIE